MGHGLHRVRRGPAPADALFRQGALDRRRESARRARCRRGSRPGRQGRHRPFLASTREICCQDDKSRSSCILRWRATRPLLRNALVCTRAPRCSHHLFGVFEQSRTPHLQSGWLRPLFIRHGSTARRVLCPRPSITRRRRGIPNDIDLDLCERLITAYAKTLEAMTYETSEPDMWSWILEARQRDVAAALEAQDVEGLAALLTSMFRQDFVLGMAPGPIFGNASSRLARLSWRLKTLDALTSLAEALGIVKVETPEQGETALAFEAGVDNLIAGLEQALGFRLDFPDVGAAIGFEFGTRLITPDTPDQIYAAFRIDQALRTHWEPRVDRAQSISITEIGGGYGSMCYWLLQMRRSIVSYTIVDLPIVNVIQGYFLGRALGPDRVSF